MALDTFGCMWKFDRDAASYVDSQNPGEICEDVADTLTNVYGDTVVCDACKRFTREKIACRWKLINLAVDNVNQDQNCENDHAVD